MHTPFPRSLVEALVEQETLSGEQVRRLVDKVGNDVDLARRKAERAAFM
jgi:hypothetical protein